MKPVTGDGYPIEIYEMKGFVKKFIPLIQLSLTAESLINNRSGLARLFGYPTPNLSSDVFQSIEDALTEDKIPDYSILKSQA
eukprot:gene55904-76637_t